MHLTCKKINYYKVEFDGYDEATCSESKKRRTKNPSLSSNSRYWPSWTLYPLDDFLTKYGLSNEPHLNHIYEKLKYLNNDMDLKSVIILAAKRLTQAHIPLDQEYWSAPQIYVAMLYDTSDWWADLPEDAAMRKDHNDILKSHISLQANIKALSKLDAQKLFEQGVLVSSLIRQ